MSLLRRYDEILERLLIELKRLYGARLVACAAYGSVGRGTPREDSDIDLLIVARDLPDGRLGRVDEYLAAEAPLKPFLGPSGSKAAPIFISPVFKTPEEVVAGSPLFLDMVEDASLLYDHVRRPTAHESSGGPESPLGLQLRQLLAPH